MIVSVGISSSRTIVTLRYMLLSCSVILGVVQAVPNTVNPLDLGSVSSCVPIDSYRCGSLVDYMVPEPVANLSNVIEEFIGSQISSASSESQAEDCAEALLEALCNEQYPSCNPVDGTVSTRVTVNCTDRLGTCTTPQFYIDKYCTFQITNASLHQCKPLIELAKENSYVFKRCNSTPFWAEAYVTEWMFNYLTKMDNDTDEFLRHQPTSEECMTDYINFRCGSVGRCWDNGNRIELIHNQTDCSGLRTLDCYSSSVLQSFDPRKEVCEAWPVGSPLPTIATPITPPTEPEMSEIISITLASSSQYISSITSSYSHGTSSVTSVISTVTPTIVELPNSAISKNYSLTVLFLAFIVFMVVDLFFV